MMPLTLMKRPLHGVQNPIWNLPLKKIKMVKWFAPVSITYGETVHIFVERKDYNGTFLPGFVKWETPYYNPAPVGLKFVDHMVGNVGMEQNDPLG